MKNNILLISILFILILATVFVAASFVQAAEPAAGLALQSKAADLSEIGSTTGIFSMGVVILLIVTLPLIFRKKK
ncbi:MAG: hypothetical protein IT310_06610 [Anaerolineales bacterium]|nr:hypothetical protein [Anaerolineales bacterium]